MTNIIAPRIRGRAYQIEKSWAFEIFIQIGPENENDPIHMNFQKKKFISKDAAIRAMKIEIPKIVKEIGKAVGGKFNGYIDLKQGRFVKDLND